VWPEMSAQGGALFRRQGGAVLKIEAVALARMLEFQQREAHHEEAGGVLLGRHLRGCRDMVVDEVTSPMPGDARMRLAFHRSKTPHQEVMDERWRTSEGTCLYLGEWHTHPEASPLPSRIDTQDWLRRLETDQFHGASLFFLIVGIDAIRAWEGCRLRRRITWLPPLDP
jgi:integrative and conjugative element protein (TIGR02256 family)